MQRTWHLIGLALGVAWGWLDEKDGRRYYFVAYYIFWQRWVRDVLGGLSSLSQAYRCSTRWSTFCLWPP
jgi:hypothetical protein